MLDPAYRVRAAQPQDQHGARAHEELDAGIEAAVHADELAVAAQVLLIGGLEARHLVRLLRVGAYHPRPGQVLLHDGADLAQLRLHGLEAVVDAPAEVPHEGGDEEERDQREEDRASSLRPRSGRARRRCVAPNVPFEPFLRAAALGEAGALGEGAAPGEDRLGLGQSLIGAGPCSPGAILLLHDGLDGKPSADREVLVKALPLILDGLRAKGLSAVRLDRLLGTGDYQSC